MITKQERARLRELVARVIPGLWRWWNSGKHGITFIENVNPDGHESPFSCSGDQSNNAELIVASRNALVPLLDALDALDAAEEQLLKRRCTCHFPNSSNGSFCINCKLPIQCSATQVVSFLRNIEQLELRLTDSRRATLEEAAGWMDEASRSTNANSNQLAQVEADTYSTAADILRERAVKYK